MPVDRIIPAYAGSTSWFCWRRPSSADHPRIRGEHPCGASTNGTLSGSSPHTRGALSLIGPVGRVPVGSSPHTRGARARNFSVDKESRIIPAYAGSTVTPSWKTSLMTDHPRIRGEHSDRSCSRGAGGRIIPAYAGSTSMCPTCSCGRGDHPRIRGEHVDCVLGEGDAVGSSPHTRGALSGDRPDPHGRRDHPRIRGEHVLGEKPRHEKEGSSPHTRGAPIQGFLGAAPEGIIPAYAGSTHPPAGKYSAGTDHPRIRGEHIQKQSADSTGKGSSPHTRGARIGPQDDGSGMRIIPAYAGSTRPPGRGQDGVSDHPRIRGEHTQSIRSVIFVSGSSPHTRGAHWKKARIVTGIGIIPAYAGSTTP